MGGDHAPGAIVEGALLAVREGVPVVLVGRREVLEPLLPRRGAPPVVHATQVVGMEGTAVASVRRQQDSSVRKALSLVASSEACAAMSCGNTGAVLVASMFDLGVLDGVERPAIATVLPRADGGRLILLDAGANVDCRPEQLACFAVLGSAYAEALGVVRPRVGLVSNGEEDTKGNMQVRATLPLLKSMPLNVVGNVEPGAAMAGACDVLVCDGFVGNVLLKAAEGAIATGVQLLREEITRRPSGWVGSVLLRGALKRFQHRVAWDAQGGGLLLGTRGVVVIGHGRATAPAVCAAIRLAWQAAGSELVDAVTAHLVPAS